MQKCFKEKMVVVVSFLYSVPRTRSHHIPGELPYKKNGGCSMYLSGVINAGLVSLRVLSLKMSEKHIMGQEMMCCPRIDTY